MQIILEKNLKILFADIQKWYIFASPKQNAEVAQLVEHNLAKVRVASSSLVFRSSSLKVQSGCFELLKFKKVTKKFARVVELVDTQDLKSCGHSGRAGSSPAPGTESL